MHPAMNSNPVEKSKNSNFCMLPACSAAYLFFSLRAHR